MIATTVTTRRASIEPWDEHNQQTVANVRGRRNRPSRAMKRIRVAPFAAAILLVSCWAAPATARQWPFDVTDLRDRSSLVILVFGDSGTGEAGQYRVGDAMSQICRQRGCDLGLILGDVLYENGIEVKVRSDADASYQEIIGQFQQKFERAYERFSQLPGFHFWITPGNHDYRKNAIGVLSTYSEFSTLWRMPALHYEVPSLPEWIQIYGVHTETGTRRALNGLQIASAKRALCAERNPERWKVVFGHHPVYNSGHHAGDANERRTRALLEGPVLRGCGVHLYLAGHAHHQEHLTVQGFEQVIQGAAAKSKGRNHAPQGSRIRQRHFSRNYGFAVMEVEARRMRIDFYDVLNTKEKGRAVVSPAPDEIVLAYSWCGTRDDVGRPDVGSPTCS